MEKEQIDLGGDKARILQEIADCREDERTSQTLTLQIVSIAEAVLGVILAASIIWKGEGDNIWILSPLSCLIFIASFSFITHLGIDNFLRYHYQRDLEKQYSEMCNCNNEEVGKGQKRFIDWTAASSAVKTLNVKHIKHFISATSFGAYIGSAVFAFIFCMTITYTIYCQVGGKNPWAKLALIIVLIIGVIDFLILFIGATKAADIYKWAKERADARIKKEGAGMSEREDAAKKYNKELRRGIIYYIYPKIQDLQKLVLIPLGAFCALIYTTQDLNLFIEKAKINIPYILVAFVLIELLLYPARYHINDVRGVKGDAQENADKEKNNEPRWGLPQISEFKRKLIADGETVEECRKRDVFRTIVVAVVKVFLALAGYIYLWWPNNLAVRSEGKQHYGYFMICTAIGIVLFTILYELVRTKGNQYWPMVLVGSGYALRFFAGFFAVYPSFDDLNGGIYKIPIIFAIMYVYGVMSVTLACTLRASRENKFRAKTKEKEYSKEYNYMLDKYSVFHPLAEADVEKAKIFKEKHDKKYVFRRILAPWNVSLISAMSLLIALTISFFFEWTVRVKIGCSGLCVTSLALYFFSYKVGKNENNELSDKEKICWIITLVIMFTSLAALFFLCPNIFLRLLVIALACLILILMPGSVMVSVKVVMAIMTIILFIFAVWRINQGITAEELIISLLFVIIATYTILCYVHRMSRDAFIKFFGGTKTEEWILEKTTSSSL